MPMPMPMPLKEVPTQKKKRTNIAYKPLYEAEKAINSGIRQEKVLLCVIVIVLVVVVGYLLWN
jgi:hypothetical protein